MLGLGLQVGVGIDAANRIVALYIVLICCAAVMQFLSMAIAICSDGSASFQIVLVVIIL